MAIGGIAEKSENMSFASFVLEQLYILIAIDVLAISTHASYTLPICRHAKTFFFSSAKRGMDSAKWKT